MGSDALIWTPDGLSATVPVHDRYPQFRPGVLLAATAALWLLALLAVVDSARAPGPVAVGEVPDRCASAPWTCTVNPDGSPIPGGAHFDDGLHPDTMERVVYGVAAGQIDLGAGRSGKCVDVVKGRTRAIFDTLTHCLTYVRDQVQAGAIDVPARMEGAHTGRPTRQAREFRTLWEGRLQRRWAAQAKEVADARAEAAGTSEAPVHLRNLVLGLALLISLGLLAATLIRRHSLRPLRIQITPQGIRVDAHVFPRTAITSARLDGRLRLRMMDGTTFASRQLALGTHDELRHALEELLLADDELHAEHAARPSVEQALDPLRTP